MSEVPPHERDTASDPPTEASKETPVSLPAPFVSDGSAASSEEARPASPWGESSDVGSEPSSDDPLGPRVLERWPPEAPSADAGSGVREGMPPGLDVYPEGVAPPLGRQQARSAGRIVREVAETIILALLIFLLVRAVVQNFQVEGSSMQPTLQSGWYLLVNKAIYYEINLDTVHKFLPFIDAGEDPTRYVFRAPRRGDVIVFKQPESAPGQERDFIKRIIGLPGEVVEVHDETVFIGGKPLDEPYILEKPTYSCQPQRVPPGHYFVLGDNRNNSSDSHIFGAVPKENLIGQAWITYWPFSAIGFINNTSVEPNADLQQPVRGTPTEAAVGLRCTP